jgi:hypothetical protein
MGIFDYFSKSPEKMLGDYFDKSIMTATNGVDNPMIAGVVVYSTIAKTYDSLKHDNAMIQKCGLSNSDYLQLLEKVLDKKGREYLSNWDEMRRGPEEDYMDDRDYLYDRDFMDLDF